MTSRTEIKKKTADFFPTKQCTNSPPTPPLTYPSPYMTWCWIDIIIWARACIAVHQDWSCASQMHTRTDSALSDLTCVLPTFAEPLTAAKKIQEKINKNVSELPAKKQQFNKQHNFSSCRCLWNNSLEYLITKLLPECNSKRY